MIEQMRTLRTLLDNEGIEWRDDSEVGTLPIDRTKFHYRGFDWSVIHGFGTYGGWSRLDPDAELLEMMSSAVDGGEPVGWLTAEEVMEYVLGG